jgi:simple sugar transport system permease protein
MSITAQPKEEITAKAGERTWIARLLRKWGLQIGISAVALVVWLFFVFGAPTTFLSGQIYMAFMQTTPIFALVALPLTLVVITKEIDLSFPSVMAWGMTVYILVFTLTGSLLLAFIGCLLAGLLAGFLNGVLVVKIGMPSLVATIGTQFLWRGVVLVVNSGTGFSLTAARDSWLHYMLVGRIGPIPAQFIWTIIFAVLIWFFLNRTKVGGHVYLVGDNIDSAKLMGIPVNARKIMVFSIVGALAAFAGLTSSMEVTYFWPTLGDGYLLRTMASVFLGGTSVFGGTGTIYGTFVACFVIGAIEAGIVASGLTGFWTQLIYGLIIVISVSIQTILSNRLR